MKPDAAFFEDYGRSRHAVDAVVRWAIRRGMEARALGQALRPTAEERAHFGDSGDIITPYGRLEVKHRRLQFDHGAYPFASIFVCERYTADRFDATGSWPLAFIIVSRGMRAAWSVRPRTRERWRSIRTLDGRGAGEREYLSCPVGLAKALAL